MDVLVLLEAVEGIERVRMLHWSHRQLHQQFLSAEQVRILSPAAAAVDLQQRTQPTNVSERLITAIIPRMAGLGQLRRGDSDRSGGISGSPRAGRPAALPRLLPYQRLCKAQTSPVDCTHSRHSRPGSTITLLGLLAGSSRRQARLDSLGGRLIVNTVSANHAGEIREHLDEVVLHVLQKFYPQTQLHRIQFY